jgi:hypothetical protein
MSIRSVKGYELSRNPRLNKGSAFSHTERRELALKGCCHRHHCRSSCNLLACIKSSLNLTATSSATCC